MRSAKPWALSYALMFARVAGPKWTPRKVDLCHGDDIPATRRRCRLCPQVSGADLAYLRRVEEYVWVRPGLHARKIRDIELCAGHPARRGSRGAACAYNLGTARQRERQRVEQAERAYERLAKG